MPKTAKELERILLNDGWVLKDQNGSHRHYIHPHKSKKITISFHGKKDIPIKTMKQILRDAGLKEVIK